MNRLSRPTALDRGLRFIALVALFFSTTSDARAQGNGSSALVIAYRAKPGERAHFRKIMSGDGMEQLRNWKRKGVIADYRALFTTFAGEDLPDMFLIVRFNRAKDQERWQRVEETMPGGLPLRAQSIASVLSTAVADVVSEEHTVKPTDRSQYLVSEYDVLVDMPRYSSYFLGYAVPQFQEWEKAGVLSSYEFYINQNPAGAPWGSFVLLEYKDLGALAARDSVKAKSRVQLAATNPVWKSWSDDKSTLRREKAGIPLRMLREP